MLYRDPEISLFDTLRQSKVGFVAYSALAQGILSEKYLNGIPENSRAANQYGYLQKSEITDEIVGKMQKLNAVAQRREQTLAQMSLAWVLRDIHVTSALVGVSTAAQLKSNLDALNNTYFSDEEYIEIDKIIYG
ncbi:MAG: L-glyceraldehyde 3-phosphate reductase [Bacteroidetes bacterium ADurb.Bin302]|nr:MAG: L-glyceraldehyde 3-phosphate reductase [Bacteroidetes bacterium ADurb.Bin302]